ncbi:TPA: 50S ribosomal protein L1 [candidate division CPR2 bacterium]|uniref:Large ribosomal subunit protein uL1 n=1 Tax=candidate division CPR2 bacterium GW2011_GWC1_41_48 TaxID=1618344 RepID=A0A0G0W7F6_UNCC2|nr:MAG: 50S ribosomal protein L1 [candidate division CPR2 bacterium GW2011_GWC2_39_35]KKR27926.1 MAG: 50S ribosomal protein L1 [candidate division CPR2 bacterium GW2011_GWD2_39_7]KKS08900.1 MAG: 50S ribosomal protein L1 [candidate division CPR2 bacterium GW2011_GWC1_41_48]HBG81717.1 50S ribosomal protein L1 [candidate division CPR2 bacterium]HCL99640.1 50S ribosomal protein L1 [candidate division CPR2 bacterium]
MAEEKKAAKKVAPKEETKEVKEQGTKSKEQGKEKAKKEESVKKETKASKTEAKTKKNKLKKSEKKFSKKYREVAELVEAGKEYPITEAVALVKKVSTSKFDGSLEIHIRLGVDLKSPEQMVRGATVLPNGTGKVQKVVVVASPDKEKEAKEAGADVVGGQDIVEKITKGWTDFDVLIATPDMMGALGKVGKILGPKGLMPNPKTGTVTMNVASTVKQAKAGRVEYRMDKTGIIHQGIGKLSFDDAKLVENANHFFDAIQKAKPSTAKGQFIKSVSVAPTMGPGIKVEINSLR